MAEMAAVLNSAKTIAGFWKIMRTLGSGTFGTVVLAEHLKLKNKVAIKCVPRSSNSSKIRREIDLHASLAHKNIVPLLSEEQDSDNFYLVMEFVPCKSLLDKIKSEGPSKIHKARKLFRQVVEGVAYMHSLNIMHGDLKLENLLIGPRNTIKICDIGLSHKVTDNDGHMRTFKGYSGTKSYMAPEVYARKPRKGLPTDVWSVGIVLIRIMCGQKPWRFACIKSPTFSEFVRDEVAFFAKYDLDVEPVDLMRACLRVDPTERPTMADVTRHPFLVTKNLDYR